MKYLIQNITNKVSDKIQEENNNILGIKYTGSLVELEESDNAWYNNDETIIDERSSKIGLIGLNIFLCIIIIMLVMYIIMINVTKNN